MDYTCGACGATGIKLWREYQTFSPQLRCALCAAREQGATIDDLDANGTRTGDHGNRTDQIGNLVPAVPDEDGNLWGYTSVPPDAAAKWRALPTFGVQVTEEE